MFGLITRRRHEQLLAEAAVITARLHTELAAARAECDAALEVAESTGRRLERALRGCARWMDAAWVETRHTDRLQARLDDALGLNDPRVLDGRNWQHLRADRRTRKETTR
ncbi:hypothetical protein [Streptomyces mexicanus]|uniref:hypothetical protein n=1 Tax=Streptomyces mexicanus TaxID=178566 RepID=UPI0036599B59